MNAGGSSTGNEGCIKISRGLKSVFYFLFPFSWSELVWCMFWCTLTAEGWGVETPSSNSAILLRTSSVISCLSSSTCSPIRGMELSITCTHTQKQPIKVLDALYVKSETPLLFTRGQYQICYVKICCRCGALPAMMSHITQITYTTILPTVICHCWGWTI